MIRVNPFENCSSSDDDFDDVQSPTKKRKIEVVNNVGKSILEVLPYEVITHVTTFLPASDSEFFIANQ